MSGKKTTATCDERLICVDAVTALQLLYMRPTVKTKPICVSVSSTVLAISEVIQIKDSQLFLVKLLPKLDIICKRKEILHLNESISPQKTYILTNLRHTTLQKGGSFPRLVYTVTKETRILAEGNDNVKMLTGSEWCKTYGCEFVAAAIEEVTERALFSYTGTITSVLDARLGVYELDREVRLYIGHIPAVHKYRDLRAGMEILIQNAHHQTSKQHPKVTMFGCMLSSVRIVKHPETDTEVPSLQTPQILKNHLYLYQLSQEKLQHLYHICKTVKEKFSHLGRRICDKLITEILKVKVLSWKQERDRGYRNHLDEFLHSPHTCCFQQETDQRFPEFIPVKSLFDNNPMTIQRDPLWHYTHQCVESNQVLLGELGVCQKTGLSVLGDYTGHTNTVIAIHSNVRTDKHDEKVSHECDVKCDCNGLEPGQSFHCPYFHTCCVGKIVAVTKYGKICEGPSQVDRQQLGDNKRTDSKKYIVFSLTDAIYLGNKKIWTLEKRNELDIVKRKSKEMKEDQSSDVSATRNDGSGKHLGQTVLPDQDKHDKGDCGDAHTDHVESHVTKTSQSNGSTLHRHSRPDGGVYFCRKVDCDHMVICDEMGGFALTDRKEIRETNKHTYESCRKNTTGQINKITETIGSVSLKPVTETSSLKSRGSCRSNTGDIFDISIKRRKTAKQNSSQDCRKSIEDNGMIENKTEQSEDNEKGKAEIVINVRSETQVPQRGKCASSDSGCHDNLEFSDASWENSLETATVVIHRKDALVMEENNGTQSARFCIQGQIIKDDCVMQAVVMFKGKASTWHSIIHPGSTYQFSISAELSPLFRNNVGNVKVNQKLKKLNSQMFMVVNELADIEQIYQNTSMDQMGTNNDSFIENRPRESHTSVFSGVFKDIQGVILSRTYVQNDSAHDRTGRIEQVCTRIKLKCPDEETVQIYLKPENFVSPLGLVPGSVVCFTRLERRVSQLGNIYWRFIPLSSVTVVSVSQTLTSGSETNVPDMHNSACPTQSLRDVWEGKLRDVSDVFMCICTVQQIMKVSLKYVCDHCGSMVMKSRCSNVGCFNTEIGRFLARASILVDDGTSVAMVTLFGDVIKDLLVLSDDQWEAVQIKASIQGEIFVQQARPELKTDMEQFLYLLCDNRLVKRAWMMKLKLKPASKYTDLDKMGSDEFGQKTFDTGTNKVTTRCLPFLQLECLQLQSVDPYQLCLTLMAI